MKTGSASATLRRNDRSVRWHIPHWRQSRVRVGGSGRDAFAARCATRASPFYEWKTAILNEPRTRSGWPLFRWARAVGKGSGRRDRAEADCERSRCQILRRGRRQRMCSFTKFPVRSPRAAASGNWVSGRRESRHRDTTHFRLVTTK